MTPAASLIDGSGICNVQVRALVVSFGRPAWLERCVRGLIQAATAAERAESQIELTIAIWINGEDADSLRVAHALQAAPAAELAKLKRSGLKLQVFQSDARLTPARARNQALRQLQEATAQAWILFIDDDAFVEPGYFLSFMAARARFPAASAIGGPNLTPPGSSTFQRACGAALSSRFGSYCSAARYRARGAARLCGDETLILCNLWVKQADLGPDPFPETFICNEENWLLQSLARAGRTLVYDPALVVHHERRGRLFSFARQVFRYGYGRGQNLKRRPATFRLAHLLPLLCLFYLPVATITMMQAPAARLPQALLLLVYVLLCLGAGLRKGAPVATALVFPVIHLAYGAGVLGGLLGIAEPRS